MRTILIVGLVLLATSSASLAAPSNGRKSSAKLDGNTLRVKVIGAPRLAVNAKTAELPTASGGRAKFLVLKINGAATSGRVAIGLPKYPISYSYGSHTYAEPAPISVDVIRRNASEVRDALRQAISRSPDHLAENFGKDMLIIQNSHVARY